MFSKILRGLLLGLTPDSTPNNAGKESKTKEVQIMDYIMVVLRRIFIVLFLLQVPAAVASQTSVSLDSWTVLMTELSKSQCLETLSGSCVRQLTKGKYVKVLAKGPDGRTKIGFYNSEVQGYVHAEALVKKRYRSNCSIFDFDTNQYVYLRLDQPELNCSTGFCEVNVPLLGYMPMSTSLMVNFDFTATFAESESGHTYTKSLLETSMSPNLNQVMHSFQILGHGYDDKLIHLSLWGISC